MEVVVEQLASSLADLGVSVTVLTSSWGQEPSRRAPVDDFRVETVWAANLFERRFSVPYPLFSPRLLWRAASLVRRSDVVHVNDCFYLSSPVCVFWARVFRKPVVLTQHVDIVPHPSRFVRLVQRAVYATYGAFVLRSARAVIVLNDRVRDFVLSRGVDAEKVHYVPNGIDLERYRPAVAEERVVSRRRLGISEGAVVALFAGRLVPKKGYDIVLACADDHYQLVFAGGRETQSLHEEHAPTCYLGTVSRADMPDLYRAADMLCLPSIGEGFPVTVQEAMSSGLAVVTTDDPAYGSYGLEAGCIELIPRTVAATRGALLGLASDRERRLEMGREARRFAAAHFSARDQALAVLALYRPAPSLRAPVVKANVARPASPVVRASCVGRSSCVVRASQVVGELGVAPAMIGHP
jgi:D-inositol-3-phosphate glycosyltransferase